MSPNSHWYCKLLCYNTIIDTRHSNPAYYYTTIDLASFPINLRYLDTKLNPLLYYNWYSNLNDIILLIQQPNILLYMTWYNYLYVMTLNTTTKYSYITWPLSLCYNTWYNNLNYYYTTRIQQALLCPYDSLDTTPTTIFYNWYNTLIPW